jgi:cold shock CspA family protein
MYEEQLDFCRVKKIDEKGFGFLKSLYHSKDIFFHFSQIKKEEFAAKLKYLKRGDFFLFFTSKEMPDGRRKVKHIWYSIEEIPKELLHNFVNRLLNEFETGSFNLFDLLFAFGEIKKLNLISDETLRKVMQSKKILNLPTTLLPHLSKDEIQEFKKILKLEELENSSQKPFWYSELLKA